MKKKPKSLEALFHEMLENELSRVCNILENRLKNNSIKNHEIILLNNIFDRNDKKSAREWLEILEQEKGSSESLKNWAHYIAKNHLGVVDKQSRKQIWWYDIKIKLLITILLTVILAALVGILVANPPFLVAAGLALSVGLVAASFTVGVPAIIYFGVTFGEFVNGIISLGGHIESREDTIDKLVTDPNEAMTGLNKLLRGPNNGEYEFPTMVWELTRDQRLVDAWIFEILKKMEKIDSMKEEEKNNQSDLIMEYCKKIPVDLSDRINSIIAFTNNKKDDNFEKIKFLALMDHIDDADQAVIEYRLNLIIGMQELPEKDENETHGYVMSDHLKPIEIKPEVLNGCFDEGKKAGVKQYLEEVRRFTKWAK